MTPNEFENIAGVTARNSAKYDGQALGDWLTENMLMVPRCLVNHRQLETPSHIQQLHGNVYKSCQLLQ